MTTHSVVDIYAVYGNSTLEFLARRVAAAFSLKKASIKEVKEDAYQDPEMKYPPALGKWYYRVVGHSRGAVLQIKVFTHSVEVDFHHKDKPHEGAWIFRLWGDGPQLWKPYYGFSSLNNWASLHTEELLSAAYRLGYDLDTLKEYGSLSSHEQLELRLSLPREFWPQNWVEEEEKAQVR